MSLERRSRARIAHVFWRESLALFSDIRVYYRAAGSLDVGRRSARHERMNPLRGWTRETRLLVVTVLLAVSVLLALARLRFPGAEPSARLSLPVRPLQQIVERASFDDLAASVTRAADRIAPRSPSSRSGRASRRSRAGVSPNNSPRRRRSPRAPRRCMSVMTDGWHSLRAPPARTSPRPDSRSPDRTRCEASSSSPGTPTPPPC